ncbi:MAG: aminoacyl-tRNA hydrolase [Desulfobacteraceae bacterium]|nr:aminoacyl-tRNA hydrolase [Desulfobacteraceae bacterium]
MISIDNLISISDDELLFTASHSSGPGGQNVNKVSSRVTLWFDVVNSPSLEQEQKDLVMRRLATRISKDGVLRVISQQTRSQLENKELAKERFAELLRNAVRRVPARKKTRVSKGAKLRRLEEKKQRGSLKQERSKKVPIEE